MIRIALVDDEAQHRITLENHLASFFRGKNEAFQCTAFSDALDLFSRYDSSFDIIFLDIDMKLSNGMEAARLIRKIDNQVVLIFETQLAQYAVEGYLVDAVGYLVKPIEFYALSLVMTKALSVLRKNRETRKIIVTEENQKIVIDAADIRYIEVLNHMLIHHTVHGDRRDWNSLNQLEKELAPFSFFRCHRCYLINLRQVTGVDTSKDEVLIGDIYLPISRGKKAALMDELMKLYTLKEGG